MLLLLLLLLLLVVVVTVIKFHVYLYSNLSITNTVHTLVDNMWATHCAYYCNGTSAYMFKAGCLWRIPLKYNNTRPLV